MVHYGFIVSQKGKGGGFYFKPERAELSLKDLITATEGNKTFTGCGFGLKECKEINPCPIHEQYTKVREAMNRLVTGESIQSLAVKLSQGKEVLSDD